MGGDVTELDNRRRAASGGLIKILIPAVGGQGGGVLTEWLVQAFHYENYDVQGVGLPGLSQRGGSTTYYLEAHPHIDDPDKRVVFAQYPVPGDVDVILCQEFLELGRVLEEGYGSPEKTVTVSSTHRIYSTLEKLPSTKGVYSSENIRALATEFSKKFIGIDALALAKQHGMGELSINAILLGALGASGALPLGEASYLKAIESSRVMVESNIKAFRIGWDYVKDGRHEKEEPERGGGSWESFLWERASKLGGNRAEAFRELVALSMQRYPIHLKEILAEAIYRLIDYQGVKYALSYLDDLDDVYSVDVEYGEGFRVTETFAKNYALWITYEDGIRVAELKIRSERFRKIAEDMRIGNEQIYRVSDYLKPDAYEIYGLLPYFVVKPFVKILGSRMVKRIIGNRTITLEQRPVTTSFLGFLRLWLVSKLKFMRPWSYRYREERKLAERYKEAVIRYTKLNYDLGLLVAESGSLIKGYGRVRRSAIEAHTRLIRNVIAPLAELDSKRDPSFKTTLQMGREALDRINASQVEGVKEVESKVEEILQGIAA